MASYLGEGRADVEEAAAMAEHLVRFAVVVAAVAAVHLLAQQAFELKKSILTPISISIKTTLPSRRSERRHLSKSRQRATRLCKIIPAFIHCLSGYTG